MASSFRVAGILAIAGATSGLAVLAACGDDDDTGVTSNVDAGRDTGTSSNADTGTKDPCANAAKPTRTKTAQQCTTELGETAIVVNGECKKVLSQECQEVIGPIDNDDAIVLGQLVNVRGSDAPVGRARIESIRLGVDEINSTAGGVYTADGCGRRPLAVVVCDDSNAALSVDAGADAGTYNRRAGATHLIELGAAAIFGPHNSNNTIEISNFVTTPASEMIIVPTAGAADITTLDASVEGTRLVWRTVPSDALQAKAVSRIGEQVEQELNKGTIKVAIVNRGDAFGRGLRDGVKADVKFNGLSWEANAAENKLELEYVTSAAPPATIKDDLKTFQPDIVYFFGLGEIFAPVIGAYETDREADPGNITAPVWISSASGQRAELLTQITNHPELRRRTRGSSSVVLSPLTLNFYSRYKENIDGGANQQLVFGMSQSYDSVYSIAYALAATPTLDLTKQVTSLDVAKAMAKQVVPAAREIKIGPDNVKEAMELLRKGDNINFTGATGPLDYNLATGEAPGDYAVWCVRNGSDSKPIFENNTGESWNFQLNQLQGSIGTICD